MPGYISLCKPNGTVGFGYAGFVMSLSVLKENSFWRRIWKKME